MTEKRLTIRHFYDTDTLVLYTENFSTEGETVSPFLSVHYNRDGNVMEVVIEHAASILEPHLFPVNGRTGKRSVFEYEMDVFYDLETDTLTLQAGAAPYEGYTEQTVAPGLRVKFDPEGWAKGVVIERAAELLRPYLLAESAGVV